MIKSWVLVMVIASTSITAHLCGAPDTTTSLTRAVQSEEGGTTAPERGGRGMGREAMLSRDERVQVHREKIENIIEENRAKRELERVAPGEPSASPLERADGFVEEGTEHFVVKLAAGLSREDAERLKKQVSEDVPHGHIELVHQPAIPKGDRYDVTLGRLANRQLALAMYRALGQSGYRFDTLPGWGSAIEKRDGAKRLTGSSLIINTPPMAPPPRKRVSVARSPRNLPDFVTSGTFVAAGQAPVSLGEYLRGKTGETATVNLAFSGAPVERVLDSIERQTGLRIGARGRVGGSPVSIIARNGSVAEVLDQILAEGGDWLLYAPPGKAGHLELWDGGSFQSQVVPQMTERRVFDIREISLLDAHNAVLPLLTAGVGTAVQIPSNNKLVVTDLPTVLRETETLLAEIDRKPVRLAPPPGVETRY